MADGTVGEDFLKARTIGRFGALLSNECCARAVYDEVLLELQNCVVAPTLGSILPYWLLVIPRTPTLNYADWLVQHGIEPMQLLNDVLAAYDIPSTRAIWFEHGPESYGSAVSCGVDQAHIHLIIDPPFSFEQFTQAVRQSSDLQWEDVPAARAYSDVEKGTSYLLAGHAQSCVIAQNVQTIGSQYFRRVIAELVGNAQAWNYRTHPFLENARRTVQAYGIRAAICEQAS